MKPLQLKPLQTILWGHGDHVAVADRLDHFGALALAGFSPDAVDNTVASWLIEARWAHPFWTHYWLVVMHLRPLVRDGVQVFEPIIYLPGATHELVIFAINPDFSPDDIVTTGHPSGAYLVPHNFAAQSIHPDDASAAAMAHDAARDIVAGRLNPDSDNLQGLIERFGSNMLKGS